VPKFIHDSIFDKISKESTPEEPLVKMDCIQLLPWNDILSADMLYDKC
jgi:hypothetical protein